MPASLLPALARLAARDGRTDADLLGEFLARADQGAFAELVRRHGPLVLGACRRYLGPTPDADDAFQATFLVLVRRARQVVWRESVGPWLYGVAVRVARKARAVRARRLAAEKQVSPMTPEPTAPPEEPDELAALLDEALAALPEAYRRPLVLCELQGLSRAAAARELGVPEGTLSSRLARGRRLLRDRLGRRGVGLAAAGLTAAVPAELAASTAGRAAAVLSGVAGAVPAAVWSLTEGVVKGMFLTKLKLSAVLGAVAVGLTAAGATWGPAKGGPAAAAADPPGARPAPPAPVPAPGTTVTYVKQPVPGGPVATIFGDVPVSREAFADYLIRRHGAAELQGFVNKQVIAHAFGRKGWVIRADDVLAALDADLKALGATREQFERDILPKHGKTMAQWTEDVIEPRLMLAQLCQDRVKTATEAELRAAFARKYGEAVRCEVRLWAAGQAAEAKAAAARARAGGALYERPEPATADGAARASGRVRAIPRAGFDGDPKVGAVAAAIKPGEVSDPVEAGGGWAVVRCLTVVPADTARSFAAERPALLAEVLQEKVTREVPKLFDQLKREAAPQYHLTAEEPKVLPQPAKQ